MFGASIAASCALVARLGEQQPAILLQHPAHRPRDVVARAAVDVRDVEAIAQHRHALVPGPDSSVAGPSGPRPNPSDLKSDCRSASRDVVEQRRERVVHERLLIGPGGRRHGAVLAGRDDVARGGGVVVSRGGRRGQANVTAASATNLDMPGNL